MARLAYLDKDNLPLEDQDIFVSNINLYRALAHSPNGVRAIIAFGAFIRLTSKLDPRLREMAILQVGYLARSKYEFSHHVKIGRDYGLSDKDIQAIINETNGHHTDLEPFHKSVLRAAREMTNNLAVSDETFAELLEDLGPERIIDLILTVSFYNGIVRILAALQIDVEIEYIKYLEKFSVKDFW